MADPVLETIRVYRREGDRFGRPTELSVEAGDALTSPLLPGCSARVAEVFEWPERGKMNP